MGLDHIVTAMRPSNGASGRPHDTGTADLAGNAGGAGVDHRSVLRPAGIHQEEKGTGYFNVDVSSFD